MTRLAAAAPTILIVEDDDDSRTLLGHLLSSEGYQVQMAANGLEGLRSARASRPDLILLDVQMPVMDGFAFRHHQLDDPALAEIPVVCVSALDPCLHKDLGVAQFVRKPIDFDRLLSVITDAVPESHARAEGHAAHDDTDVVPIPHGELAYSRVPWGPRPRLRPLWRLS